MPVYLLHDNDFKFPPVENAEPDGIIAVGGDISPERMIAAYSEGIFPWFNPTDIPVWYTPDPRFILYPNNLVVSKSMRQLLKTKKFEVTFDQRFEAVMRGCKDVERRGQDDPHDTWISEEMIASCKQLHEIGFMHSVEVWDHEHNLVGGLYGGTLGKCFFGESMFAKASNASKYGFIMLAKNLQEQEFELIDCQVYSEHLKSLGAEEIPRHRFIKELKQHISEVKKADWGKLFRTDFAF